MARSAPPGFDLEPLGKGLLLLRSTLRGSPLARALRSGRFEQALEERYEGRGSVGVLDAGGERFVVRRYRHGGLLRRVTGECYASPNRAFREAALYEDLQRRGVPTLEAVAVVARRRVPFGFHLALLTREVPRARDLLSYLSGAPPLREARAVLRRAGETVALLHEAGFRHADLHPKNLLVSEGAVLVIDLDRGAFVPSLSPALRRGALARLLRYLHRVESRSSRTLVTATDLVRFLRAYAGSTWRSLAPEVLAQFRRTLPAHRAGWLLERLVAGRRLAPALAVPQERGEGS
ncbi:MAG TPA: lipopolysaccharide kinase InaA family protein [Planctomycetota bacterium]|nr:lipopolysaccharide kinase InaA family protein [Planctomycetota bacterium]